MDSEPTIFLVACLMSLALTVLIREIAPRIGLTDNPDGRRKLHGRATPLGGGVAVYLTTAIILGTLWISPSVTSPVDAELSLQAGEVVSTPEGEKTSEENLEAVNDDHRRFHPSISPSVQKKRSDISEGQVERGTVEPADIRSKLRKGYPFLPTLLLAGLVIVLVGLVDDMKGLPGKVKLLGQVVAASILISSGLMIRAFELFGYEFYLGWLAYPFTLFWLLGAINALNLLDGLDGLATMLGIILSGTIAAMSVVTGNEGVAITSMVFAASLLGFMRFNFPPASIFLGDTGSMLIGLMVGGLAIHGSLKGPGTVLLAAPLAVWTIPFFDSAAAILRRKLTGKSIYATDRGHLHHRLMNSLGSNRRVLGWVGAACVVISLAAIIGLVLKDDRITLLTCFGVVAIFIATGLFGRVELLLVGSGIRRVGHILSRSIRGKQTWQTSIRLQGSCEWDVLWATFVESADKFGLCKIRLDVNIPTIHEAYHAAWERPLAGPADRCWHVDIPLVVGLQMVGRIQVSAERNGESACVDISQLMELIEPFEGRLQVITQEKQDSRNKDLPAVLETQQDEVDDFSATTAPVERLAENSDPHPEETFSELAQKLPKR